MKCEYATYKDTYKGLLDDKVMTLYRSGSKYGSFRDITYFTISPFDAWAFSDGEEPLYSAKLCCTRMIDLTSKQKEFPTREDKLAMVERAKMGGFDCIRTIDDDASGVNRMVSYIAVGKKPIRELRKISDAKGGSAWRDHLSNRRVY